MRNFKTAAWVRIATLALAGTALSGCVYDVGLGYASDGYYDDYGCDPYGGYDSYYDCDYRSGFSNIGFGGGWYDSFWYPGYGYYLFDNYGRRYEMRDSHRRYWGERRHNWYRENRGRDGNGYRGRGRGRNYSDNGATPGVIGWPERNGGRVRDDDDRRDRREGRRNRGDQWRGGEGNGADAVPVPNPDVVRPGRGRERGEGYGRRNRRGDGVNAVPGQPPVAGEGGRGERRVRDGGGEGNGGDGNRQRSQQTPPPQVDVQVYQPEPAPRNDPPRPQPLRERRPEGAVEQPQ